MSRLEAHGLSYGVRGATLVKHASFTLSSGLTALLGPNGAGKSTTLRLALGLLTPTRGRAELDGRDIRTLSSHERARAIAYLPQTRPLAWPVGVRDVVALGRFAHGGPLARLDRTDAEAVDRALRACDLKALADRPADTLSGGELARVHLARALASEAPIIVADEPVAALDPLHQHRVMALLREAADRGTAVLVVLHDLALAGRYADRLIWMRDGEILANGTVEETLTAERVALVYGVHARIIGGDSGPQVFVDGPVEPTPLIAPRRGAR